jgi:ribose 5-phosphate isomerase B
VNIVVGADHGGYSAKERLVRALAAAGHRVIDVGTGDGESVDYPDFAARAAHAVAEKKADRGVLLCGTGIGMAIAANKVRGIRAAVVWNKKTAVLAAEHNDANVLCLGARLLSGPTIVTLVKLWLATPFGGNRHARRVDKIRALERGNR